MSKPMHRAIVSPRGPEGKVMSSLRSPTTITLGNQSENIVRGMTGVMVTPSLRPHPRFTQTSYQPQLPLLPNMQTGEPSRPIRITRRKPMDATSRYATQQSGEDLLSASPSELKLMYDEATWRMYHLIQTARMEKEAAKASSSGSSAEGNWPSNDQFIYDDSFFQLQQQNTPPPASMGMRPAVVSPDEDFPVDEDCDDCVFELDDM